MAIENLFHSYRTCLIILDKNQISQTKLLLSDKVYTHFLSKQVAWCGELEQADILGARLHFTNPFSLSESCLYLPHEAKETVSSSLQTRCLPKHWIRVYRALWTGNQGGQHNIMEASWPLCIASNSCKEGIQ